MNKVLYDAVTYSSDKISLKNVTVENYISTDNLLQNKNGKVVAEKLPPQGGSVTRYEVGDILVANIRPYLKKIWYADQAGGNSSDVLTFKVNSDYDSRFIYYAMFRDDFFKHMMNGSKGTKMPRGDKDQILEFPIPDFDKSVQTSIANILSKLDKKISINNDINNQLETLIKLVYNYWFVQFDFPNDQGKPYKSSGGKMVYNKELKREIPEGWEVKELAGWIEKDKNGDWGKESEQGNYKVKVSCIRGADLNGLNGKGELKAPVRYILKSNANKILDPNDLIVEISGGSPTQSTGRLGYITEETLERFDNPLICSNFCKALSLKDTKQLFYFVFLWNAIYENDILFGWEGKTSGIKNLLFDSFINNYNAIKPDERLVERFNSFIKPIHSKIQKNLFENQQLTELRDWLLPMLMNGQVTVGEVQEKLDTLDMAAEEKVEYGK